MNKTITLFLASLLVFLTCQSSAGQSYGAPEVVLGRSPGILTTWPNPDFSNNSYPAGWTIIQPYGTTAVWSPVVTLSFPFQFFGQPVTRFKVASTGVLTFTTTATTVPGTQPQALPAAQLPDLSICVWPQVLRNNLGTITLGTAPHRQQWIGFDAGFCIVLEETSNAVYLVKPEFAMPSNQVISGWTFGLQKDATHAVQVSGSPAVPALWPGYGLHAMKFNQLYSNTYYYAFRPTPAPSTAVALVSHRVVPLADRRRPVAVAGVLRNVGTQPLTAYQLGYRVGNGPAVVAAVTLPQPIASGDTASFRMPQAWQPTAAGTVNLRLWATAANDPHPLDDTLRATVWVADSTMPRKVLLESMGSSTCPPCGPGNTNVRTVNRPVAGRFLEAHYQQNYPAPGDIYATPEASYRLAQYYSGSSFGGGIPSTTIDGLRTLNSIDYRRSDFDRAAAVPAVVRLSAAYRITGNNVVGRTVQVAAQIQALTALGPDYDLQIAITERSTRNNAYLYSEPEFYHVFRKFVYPFGTSAYRIPALSSSQRTTTTQQYTFPVYELIENYDSLQVIVFAQHRNHRIILQSAEAVLNGPLLSITTPTQQAVAFELLPNPAAGSSMAQFTLPAPEVVHLTLCDALGRRLVQLEPQKLNAGTHRIPLVINDLSSGIYLVQLTTGKGTAVQRLVVK